MRFLPLYDNVYLGFDNRGRMLEENDLKRVNMLREFKPAVLMDGIISAGWSIDVKKGAAVIEIEPYHTLDKAHLHGLEHEALPLLKFMRADATSYDVRLQSRL